MPIIFDREQNLRASPILLNTKAYTIPTTSPYMVSLEEVPNKTDGVTIAGMTEVSSMPTATNTFFVNYLLGDIYFHASNAGQQVTPSYWGRGSLVRAEDINNIYKYVEFSDLITAILRATAQNTPNRSIKIEAGIFYYAGERKSYAGNSNVDMGPGGAYQLTALTANYFNKVLFTLDASGALKKYEGTQAGTKAGVVAPTLLAGEIPVCMVTVQDDGTGGAGTINNIQQTDIEDLRTYIWIPDIRHRYLTVHLEGFPIFNDVFFDGHYLAEAVIIDKITLSARTAPTGSNLQIELLKNGVATGKVATLSEVALSGVTRSNMIRSPLMCPASSRSSANLPHLTLFGIGLTGTTLPDMTLPVSPQSGMYIDADRLYQSTTLSPTLSLLPTDRLSLKVVAVDSSETAEGIEILLAYS